MFLLVTDPICKLFGSVQIKDSGGSEGFVDHGYDGYIPWIYRGKSRESLKS